MSNLLPEERETILSMTGADHDTWFVFSDDPVMLRKLEKVAEFVRVIGAGKEFRLDANQITLRAKPKPLSDARKAQLARQAEKMRKSLVITSAFDLQLGAVDGNDVR